MHEYMGCIVIKETKTSVFYIGTLIYILSTVL